MVLHFKGLELSTSQLVCQLVLATFILLSNNAIKTSKNKKATFFLLKFKLCCGYYCNT
jgi:hypothetical protein